MTNKDLDNLLSQINKDLDSMNKEIEENNAFYLPKIAKRQSKTNVIKWFLFVSIFLIMIGAYITSKYKDEYVWYFAYIPLMASALIFLILFIIFIISFFKVMKIKKEFKEAQVKTNDLQILIERHSKIARSEILERFGETKDEVIRVIGTSLPDLIEYYEYFKDFVLNHPNEKPEVKKIRNFEFGFEKITIKKHFKDSDVIESLSHELSVKNYDEIIQIIKNGITKGHVKIYGFIYSFALLNFPKNDYERILKKENNKKQEEGFNNNYYHRKYKNNDNNYYPLMDKFLTSYMQSLVNIDNLKNKNLINDKKRILYDPEYKDLFKSGNFDNSDLNQQQFAKFIINNPSKNIKDMHKDYKKEFLNKKPEMNYYIPGINGIPEYIVYLDKDERNKLFGKKLPPIKKKDSKEEEDKSIKIIKIKSFHDEEKQILRAENNPQDTPKVDTTCYKEEQFQPTQLEVDNLSDK